jgi:hypothetical protein
MARDTVPGFLHSASRPLRLRSGSLRLSVGMTGFEFYPISVGMTGFGRHPSGAKARYFLGLFRHE